MNTISEHNAAIDAKQAAKRAKKALVLKVTQQSLSAHEYGWKATRKMVARAYRDDPALIYEMAANRADGPYAA